MKNVLAVFLTVPAAFGITVLWWRLWMYSGLIGPPPILKPFITADGEGVSDRVAVEMFIVVWLISVSAILLLHFRRRRPGNQ